MIVRRAAALAAAAGLALAPLAGEARILTLPTCTGGAHIVVLAGDPAAPHDDRRGCGKACHAATERRAKAARAGRRCC